MVLRDQVLSAVGKHPELAYDLLRDMASWIFLGPWHEGEGRWCCRGWQGVRPFTVLLERRPRDLGVAEWDWGLHYEDNVESSKSVWLRGAGQAVSEGPWDTVGAVRGSVLAFMKRHSTRLVFLGKEPWDEAMSSGSLYEEERTGRVRDEFMAVRNRVLGDSETYR